MPDISVVIPTYNRPALMERAYKSAANSSPAYDVEIIFVDDASTMSLPDISNWPGARLIRMPENAGPGMARMAGIRAATADIVTCLDDDDSFRPGAIERMVKTAAELFARNDHENMMAPPVIQFARTNGSLLKPELLLDLDGYLNGDLAGDFVPVINKNIFLSRGYSFPDSRVGAEHLLWWHIAKDTGIPSFSECLVDMGDDGADRLTGIEAQISKAPAHLAAAVETLERFGPDMQRANPALLRKKQLGVVTYALLASEDQKAKHYSALLGAKARAAFWVVALLPIGIRKSLFRAYRKYG